MLCNTVIEISFAHVKEISQHDCRRRTLYGLGQGAIIVGTFFTLIDEVGQLRVLESQGIDLLRKLINQPQLGVFIWLREGDI